VYERLNTNIRLGYIGDKKMDDDILFLIGLSCLAIFALLFYYYFEKYLPAKDFKDLNNKLKYTKELIEMLDNIVLKLESEDEGFSEIKLKKSEKYLMSITPCSLVEPRIPPAKYVGGHSGVTVKVAKGVYFRTGRSKARRIPQAESLKIIDSGTLHVTNQRAVFTGLMRNRVWEWKKLINYSHNYEHFSSLIHVSSRQKSSGIGHVDSERETAIICFSIDIGIASFYNEIDQIREKLIDEKNSIENSIISIPGLKK
jgi:hypothetical protein